MLEGHTSSYNQQYKKKDPDRGRKLRIDEPANLATSYKKKDPDRGRKRSLQKTDYQ